MGKRVKDVIDALLAAGSALSHEELAERCSGLRVDQDTELLAALQAHERVEFVTDSRLRYRSQHTFTDKVCGPCQPSKTCEADWPRHHS